MASRRAHRSQSHLGGMVLLSSVAFASEETNNSIDLKWNQVCTEGVFLGHPNFAKIEWTPEVFATIVANFRKHPSYKTGPDGKGCARVVPWDYEHANEMRRMRGDIPPEGLPAASWTHDLEVRTGEDGKTSLWALTEWLHLARQQILDGVYQGASVCVQPKYIDPVSGKDQGPTLTSIALTNDPFVQGMMPLAATLDQYGPAESLLEVAVGLAKAFELPDSAKAPEILDSLHKFFDAYTSDTLPEYVEGDYLLDRVRRLLALPLLATPEEILGGAEAALNSLPTEGDQQSPQPKDTMALTPAMLTLAAILCCKEEEPAILQAAQAAKAKADASAKTEEEAATNSNSLDQLKALFGSGDLGELLARATKTISDAKALEQTVAALNEARKALSAGATADAEAETEAVAASLSGGDPALAARFRPVILAARTACIDMEKGTVDEAKLTKFRTDYPLPEAERALLTRRIVAGPNGTQLGGTVTGLGTQPITQSAGHSPDPQIQKVVEAFNASPGCNPVEKANALLCSRSETHKGLDYATQCRVAGEFVRTIQAGQVPQGFTL